jgi:hypothetical protein
MRRIVDVRAPARQYDSDPDQMMGSGAPPVLVAFGDYDAIRLLSFAAKRGGSWWRSGSYSLFQKAAE